MSEHQSIQSNVLAENDSHLPTEVDNLRPADIRSEEVSEIIGKVPHWIVRTGITVIGLLGVILLVVAYFFKYPDLVPAKVIISSGNPPVKLIARNSLPIQRILVANHQFVTQSEVLCVFSNSARYEDVLAKAQSVSMLDTSLDIRQSVQTHILPVHVQLGELQADYAMLYEAVQGYNFFLRNNVHDATIGALVSQEHYSNQLNVKQQQRQALQQSQLKIQQRQFEADSSLLNDKIISRMEFEEAQKKMLDQQMNANSNGAGIIQNKIQQSEYRKSIALTSFQKQSEENALQQKTREAIQRYKAALAQWEQNYILKSPLAGTVTFYNVWKENQSVVAGEGIMLVAPPISNFIVRGIAGVDRYGKVVPGQKVLLKLQAYPYQEYGILEARITSRSAVAMDGGYALEMKLANGLITNSGRKIPYSPSIEATAEIITEDKSLLQRLFEKVMVR